MKATTLRYALKPDPHSSHSIILRWLGEGRGRRVLDVGAAAWIVSLKLSERGRRVTGVEGDPTLAAAGAPHCERMITANLNREIPEIGGRSTRSCTATSSTISSIRCASSSSSTARSRRTASS